MSEGKGVKFLKALAERGLLLTLGLGLLVRIYLLFAREYVIVNDGLLYVTWIEKICELGFKGAFTNAYPFNLFPLFCALLYKAGHGLFTYETAALTINFICGLLSLIPPYLLARRIFGKMPALVTGFYVAWHPIFTEVSCQVLREAPAICLGLWALYFMITALESSDPEEWSYKKLALSAALILLALMIRLEMLALLFAGFAAVSLSHWRNTIALYYLMSKYDYESITVTDICAKARVSRMSFYRYFNNKEDIFINYCDERFEEFFASLKEKQINDIMSFLIEVFIYLKKYARQVTILKKAKKENLIVEKFTDYGTYLAKRVDLTIDNNPVANRIIAAFLAGGTANILLLWFDLGLDVPPKEMAEMAYNIFRSLKEKTTPIE